MKHLFLILILLVAFPFMSFAGRTCDKCGYYTDEVMYDYGFLGLKKMCWECRYRTRVEESQSNSFGKAIGWDSWKWILYGIIIGFISYKIKKKGKDANEEEE